MILIPACNWVVFQLVRLTTLVKSPVLVDPFPISARNKARIARKPNRR